MNRIQSTRRGRTLRTLALAGTMLCPALTSAFAQIDGLPQTRELIDANGVELFRGVYTVDETVASIGGNQGMSYRRIARGQRWHNNAIPLLNKVGSTLYVIYEGRTDRFIQSGSTYTPTEGNGSTLTFSSSTNIYTYTARNGGVVTFNKALVSTGYNTYGNEGLATMILEPNGQKLEFNYQLRMYCEYFDGDFCAGGYAQARRLGSIKSAYGYMLNFSYQSDDLDDGSQLGPWYALSDWKLVNLAVEYCAVQPGCETTQSWPSGSAPNHLLNSYTTSGGLITGVRRPGSSTNDLTITYSNNKVATVADHAGSTSYSYSDAGGARTVTVTNALSEVDVYTFDIASERLTSFKNALNQTTSYQYDSSGRLTRTTQPEGNYTQLTYDGRGNVTEARMVAKPGSGDADIVTSAAYLSTCTNAKICNSPTSTTDARGNVTNYTYDGAHGGVLTVTAPAPVLNAVRPKVTYTYASKQAQIKNSAGSIVGSGTNVTLPVTVSQCQTQASCSGGADEVKTTVTYGATGVANNLMPTEIAKGSGNGALTATNKLAYDNVGNLVSIDGPLTGTDDTTTAVYDTYRRVAGTITPDPDGSGSRPRLAQRNTYAANGDNTKTEIGTVTAATSTALQGMTVAQTVDVAFDADGRKVKETLSGTGGAVSVTQLSYDAEGRLACTAQRMNAAVFSSLPTSACSLGTEGTFGPDRITKVLRDQTGRVTQVKQALATTSEANERTLAFTANGKLDRITDAEANRTTYEYDGHDRLKKTRFPVATQGLDTSSTTDYEQLTLDASGNVTSKRLRDGQSIAYTVDALGRVTDKNLPGSEPDATYAYDAMDRLISATQNGMTTTITWDALSRKTSESAPQGSVTSQYDLADRRTRVRLPGTTTLYADYEYDLLGNPTFIRENGATSGVGVLANYQYDSLSRLNSVVFGNGVVQGFSFDAVSRLATQTLDLANTANDLTLTMARNPVGQISAVTRSNDIFAWTGHSNQNVSSSVNGLNQITNLNSPSVSYDLRGNATAIGSDAYEYTSENFLKAGPGGSTLSYDPLGRLYHVAIGSSSARMGYDGLDRIADYDGNNAILSRYIHGAGIDHPVVWYDGAGLSTRRFLSGDERGSIIAITDSNGAVIGLNKYDEFGTPSSNNQGVFGYTGQTWLQSVGLWYYKARLYRPDIGRFLQTDPIGYADSPNPYAYVLNDAVNLVDPTGEAWATGRMPGADGGGAKSYWQMIQTVRNAFPSASEAVIREALDTYLSSTPAGSMSTTGSIAGSLLGSGGGSNMGAVGSEFPVSEDAIVVTGSRNSVPGNFESVQSNQNSSLGMVQVAQGSPVRRRPTIPRRRVVNPESLRRIHDWLRNNVPWAQNECIISSPSNMTRDELEQHRQGVTVVRPSGPYNSCAG